MTKRIRVGLAGSGFVADSSHMPSYREIESVEIIAVSGRNQNRTEHFAKRWNIKNAYYGESAIEKICRDPRIDLIDVCLPNDLHLEAIELAAENHKHIICEKPLGRNREEAKRALQAANRYGVIHCYAENHVFVPQLSRTMEFIDKHSIGNINWVRAREAHSGPHSDWFWDPKRSGGGVLLDMGCHSIEAERHILKKKPTEVNAWCATLVHKIESEDNSLVIVRYEDGSIGQSENSWSALGGLDMRFEIYGEKGTIFVNPTRETGITVYTTAPEERSAYVVEKAEVKKGWLFPTWREHQLYGYLDELRNFVTSISENKEPKETFRDGYLVNSIIDAAYESSKKKRWISIGS